METFSNKVRLRSMQYSFFEIVLWEYKLVISTCLGVFVVGNVVVTRNSLVLNWEA